MSGDDKILASDELGRYVRTSKPLKTDADWSAAEESTSGKDFWPEIERLADACDEVLKREGFPAAMEAVKRENEDGGKVSTLCFKYIEDTQDEISNVWYAAKIGYHCRVALMAEKRGEAGKPWLLNLVFHIATLQSDWRWRHNHKPSILTGRKTRSSLEEQRVRGNAAKTTNALARQELVKSLAEETNCTSGALDQYLAKRLKENHNIVVSVRPVRRDRSTE